MHLTYLTWSSLNLQKLSLVLTGEWNSVNLSKHRLYFGFLMKIIVDKYEILYNTGRAPVIISIRHFTVTYVTKRHDEEGGVSVRHRCNVS